jgi:outer membrane protein TolC
MEINPASSTKRPARFAILGTLCCAVFVAGPISMLAQSPAQTQNEPAAAATPPVVITLQEALKRAQGNEPNFATALANARVAGLDKSIARAALLPSARFNGQGLYVQPNGLREVGGEGVVNTNPKFVSSDARPREYIAQGIVEETVSLSAPGQCR